MQSLQILYYAGKSIVTFLHSGNTFLGIIQSMENLQTLHYYIFDILQYFATKLDNCLKFRMLFPAVLIDFPNSKVCLIGELPIDFTSFSKLIVIIF